MRETEKFSKTMNDGFDYGIAIGKWIVIGTVVIIVGGALMATLLTSG